MLSKGQTSYLPPPSTPLSCFLSIGGSSVCDFVLAMEMISAYYGEKRDRDRILIP